MKPPAQKMSLKSVKFSPMDKGLGNCSNGAFHTDHILMSGLGHFNWVADNEGRKICTGARQSTTYEEQLHFSTHILAIIMLKYYISH